jgi:hypothetical protein
MIDLAGFAQTNPFLFHLTAMNNVPSIISSRTLFSTKRIVFDNGVEDATAFVRRRRPVHVVISRNGTEYHIRDQRPVSTKALLKCLIGGITVEDYFELLNERVFLWPTVKRLTRHYDRYKNEKPAILRFVTSELLGLNPHAEFSRLNSGATRANSYLGGIAPPRGRTTFCSLQDFPETASAVAEVTFVSACRLPKNVTIAKSPAGPWRRP